jgi:hypothetical protein
MTNSVYYYNNRIDFENRYNVQDFTSIYFGNLSNELNKYPDYFIIIDINNDEKMENLSYQLYGSENYADLILACNSENFLWGVPYNQDTILDLNDSFLKNFKYELNIDEEDEGFEAYIKYKEALLNDLDTTNSKKRKYRVPKKENLADVVNIINNYISEWNDTNWRLDIHG